MQAGSYSSAISTATAAIFGLALLSLSASRAAAADGEPLILGVIEFPTSGSAAAQQKFVTGVLALHSFWYEQARDSFIEAQQLEPSFGMAYWGEAMSYDNAFNTVAERGYESQGEAVTARISALDAQGLLVWTERERAYLEAVQERFNPDLSMTEKRRNYGQAMESLVRRFPDDDEAQVFAALALMSFPAFERENPSHIVLAAAPLEEIYERNPGHPGALHYLIHAYDTAAFARLGLRQARRYAGLAPSSSHALHMPSHIFKHLDLWPEVAASNLASYQASVRWQEASGHPLAVRDWHSLNWLLDAYLRLGQVDAARELIGELAEIEAEMARRGEEPGAFPAEAAAMRQLFQSATNPNISPGRP